MKKIIILVVLTISSFGLINAQPFEMGTNVLGVGIGIGGHYAAWNSSYSSTPAIGISYEHGIKDGLGPGTIAIGGYIGYYKGMSYHYGLRGIYHYNFDLDDNLDLYGGLMLSYASYASNIYFSLFVGGRYYFTNNVGVFMELGYGISYLTVGLNFKL